TQLKVHSSTGRSLRELHAEIGDPHRAAVESVRLEGDSALVSLRAGVQPGDIKLVLSSRGFEPRWITLRTSLDISDNVGDGTPDFLRLHDAVDRDAFRRWFTLLAEAEYYRQGPSDDVNDCAALLRHSYRETLRQHDPAWARSVTLPAATA